MRDDDTHKTSAAVLPATNNSALSRDSVLRHLLGLERRFSSLANPHAYGTSYQGRAFAARRTLEAIRCAIEYLALPHRDLVSTLLWLAARTEGGASEVVSRLIKACNGSLTDDRWEVADGDLVEKR